MAIQFTRKQFVATTGLLMASGTLYACGGKTTDSKASAAVFKTNGPEALSPKSSTVNDADEDGILTVGFDQEFPPYGYVGDDGVFTGFDLSLAAEVAARNGWDLNCVPLNWDAKDTELNSGAIDCIWNGFTIETREDGYAFTDPYMNNSQVVIVRTDSGIADLNGLAGKVVMVQADSTAQKLLEAGGDQEELAQTFAKLEATPDYNTAMLELESGAVDAVAIDEPVAKFQIADRENTFVILNQALSTEHYGVGFELSNTKERDAVQATLLEMVADGTVEKICAQYADQGISFDSWVLGV